MPSVDDIPQMKEAGLEDVFDRNLATFAGRLATFEKFNWPHGDDETCTAEKVSTAPGTQSELSRGHLVAVAEG